MCDKTIAANEVFFFPRKGREGKSLYEEVLVWPTTFWNSESASISDNEHGCEFLKIFLPGIF